MPINIEKRFNLIKILIKRWSKHNNAKNAAVIAFFTLFSFAPLISLSAELLSFFFNEDTIKNQILKQSSFFLTNQANTLIENFLTNIDPAKSISVLSLLLFLYTSSLIFIELKLAMNNIWFDKQLEFDSQKELWFNKLKDIFACIFITPCVVCILLFNTVFRSMLSFISINLSHRFKQFAIPLNVAESTASFCVTFLIFYLLIRYLPSWKANKKNILLTSVLITFMYEIGRILFGIYTGHSRLLSFYGTASSLVVFMLWIYYLSNIFLFGIEIIKFLEQDYDRAKQR